MHVVFIHMKLKHLFILWFGTMLLLLVIFFPEDRPIRMNEVSFHMPENEELFFKNLRAYYYDYELNEESNFKIYRIKSRDKDSTSIHLNFAIIQNWLQDEAYIMPEITGIHNDSLVFLCVHHENKTDTLPLQNANAWQHYQTAAEVYMALRQNARFSLINTQNQLFPLWANPNQALSIKKTLKDYFKLVGKMP